MPNRIWKRGLFLLATGTIFLIACGLWSRSPIPFKLPRISTGQKATERPHDQNVRLPDYTFYQAQPQTPFEVALGPFPFQIQVRWQPLTENEPTPWDVLVTNTDEHPHALRAIEIQGALAALTFQSVEPRVEVQEITTPDGTKAKRFIYDLELDPGEAGKLRLEVTTYFGMPVRGAVLFCADEIAIGTCMVLPLEVPVH